MTVYQRKFAVTRLLFLVSLLAIPSRVAFARVPRRATTSGVSSAKPAKKLPAPVACDSSKGSCWQPPIGTEWQWQLTCDTPHTCTNLAVKVPFYVIDWQDNPALTVAKIHAAGGFTYCYIDIGTWEPWRPDHNKFPRQVLGRWYGNWGERWLDIRRVNILGPIMTARMDVCKRKGFDGVEFDNVDGWQSGPTGFHLTQGDDQYYSAWMANAAHSRGLSASWENAADNAPVLQPYMDALILEQCYENQFCYQAAPMIKAGKWVGGVEYKRQYKDMRFCPVYENNQMVGMFKRLALDSYGIACQ